MSKQIVSWNVNGIRACVKKGFLDYLNDTQPDILCLQEIKATESDLPDEVAQPYGYHTHWFPAQKKGYSGVAILSKLQPLNVVEGFGIEEFDSEGRVLMAEYANFYVFSVYFPNGQRDDERLQYKSRFYRAFFDYCESVKAQGKPVYICGDYNTAHHEIDLARPKENRDRSGFLPIERQWLDEALSLGYIDTFRKFNSSPHEYSWWSYRANARRNNVGWRIDYVYASQLGEAELEDAFIHQSVMGSDHCPVGITIR